MAYGKLYGRQVFEVRMNEQEFIFTCYGQSTSTGFRHLCFEGYSNTEKLNSYLKESLLAKVVWCNRTWERFQYETVLRKGIENLYESEEIKQELKDILIEKKAQAEHEECERQVKAFEILFNGLSEKNKEHIRNGVGENGIQSEEQANMVMGVMQAMTLLQ